MPGSTSISLLPSHFVQTLFLNAFVTGSANGVCESANYELRVGNRRVMHWSRIILAALWLLTDLLSAQADPSVSLPRSSSATEQQLHDETLYLKEETVSVASRYEQPISKAPSDVYVITDEDIKLSGATDIPTLLRQVPGMEVMQTTTVDFNVSVRGNNQLLANKLLVLIDGRSVYIDQSGQVLWKFLPVTLTEIKRIELLKGPASACLWLQCL